MRLKALGGSLKVLQVFRTMVHSPMEFLISTTTALRIPTQSQRTGAAKKPPTTFSTYPRELARIVEEGVKPRLEEKEAWTSLHREALVKLRARLARRLAL